MTYALFVALIGALLGGFCHSIDKSNQKDKENLVDKDDLVWVGLIISIVLVLIPLLLELAFYFMFISFHGDNVLNVTVILAAIFFFHWGIPTLHERCFIW